MKIIFNQKISLAVNDYNWGDEYKRKFNKAEEVQVTGIVDNTHGYKDIHFHDKIVAEGVQGSVFTVVE